MFFLLANVRPSTYHFVIILRKHKGWENMISGLITNAILRYGERHFFYNSLNYINMLCNYKNVHNLCKKFLVKQDSIANKALSQNNTNKLSKLLIRLFI